MSIKMRLTMSAAVTALAVMPALAQQNQQQAQAGQQAEVQGLEEIVVTAQRRETKLQDTPIAVTALSEIQIERGQIGESLDLGRIVPNLIAYNNVTLGASNSYFLRGIGSTESIATFDPPVGTYVDEVFVARQNANNIQLFEVERIEVLRGPQGSLFGRNTTGGAISIITKKPDDQYRFNAEAAYGRFNEINLKGSVNIPLTDNLFAAISTYFQKDDGWQRSVRTNEKFNFIDAFGVRGAVRFQPTDAITWDVSGDWQTQDHQNLQSIVDPARATTNRSVGKDGPWVLGNARRNDVYLRNCKNGAGPLQWVRNGCTANEVIGYNFYSNLAVDFGEAAALNIITGYRNLDHNFVSPLFASLRGGFELPLSNAGNHNQFSNEIKVTGTLADGVFRYTTGLFYMKEDNLTRFETSLAAPPGNVFLVLDDAFMENDTKSLAMYAQGEYDIDKFTLIAGIRWTDEKKVIPQYTHGGGVKFTLRDIIARGIPDGKTAVQWTPKFVVQYNASDDVMIYASATRGFKSGGWNARASTAERMTRFNEETVWSYELGTRAEFLDNRLRTNVTAFSVTYSNLQLPALLRTPAVGEAPIFVTNNAGKARVQGVEFEGNALLTEGLTGSLSFGVQDGDYLELGAGVVAGGFSLDDQTDRTPHFSSNVGLTYEVPGDVMDGSLAITGDFQHMSKFEGNGPNNPENQNQGFDTINASINWTSGDERWGVQLGCKNCTDERIMGTHFLNARFIQDPMRWSLRFKYSYN